MYNKMEKVPSLPVDISAKNLDKTSANKEEVQSSVRIFPPQSHLFESKEDKSTSPDNKNNYRTTSNFKSKSYVRHNK